MKKKKTYTEYILDFGDRIKHWTGIPRRHLALLFVTRGGALRSDLWSGDQAGEGPTDC